MLYLWYNEPLTAEIYTRHESENQNWQKEGKEQKSSTERPRKDWRTMCLSCPSFQSTGKPASGRKKKRESCGKVTLNGDVGGIYRRRTFWKVVGWSHWSPTSSSPPPLIILSLLMTAQKPSKHLTIKRSGSERALNVARSIRQTVPQRSMKQWWQWRRGGVTFSPWVYRLKTHTNTEVYSLATSTIL